MWTIREAGAGEARTEDARRAETLAAIDIRRRSVKATHDFLAPGDFAEIEEMVHGFLPEARLTLALDDEGTVAGFMVLSGGRLEALFIDLAAHGRGAGRALVEHALPRFPRLVSEVNEQNEGAVAFCARLDFTVTGRSERGGQGRPYPLLHLARDAAAARAVGAFLQDA